MLKFLKYSTHHRVLSRRSVLRSVQRSMARSRRMCSGSRFIQQLRAILNVLILPLLFARLLRLASSTGSATFHYPSSTWPFPPLIFQQLCAMIEGFLLYPSAQRSRGGADDIARLLQYNDGRIIERTHRLLRRKSARQLHTPHLHKTCSTRNPFLVTTRTRAARERRPCIRQYVRLDRSEDMPRLRMNSPKAPAAAEWSAHLRSDNLSTVGCDNYKLSFFTPRFQT